MDIEKSLKKYLDAKGSKLDYNKFNSLVTDGMDTANKIFKLVNNEVDNMTDKKCLDRTIEVIKYLGVILANNDQLNRKVIYKKLFKLEEKLDTIEEEGKNKFNMKHLHSEFDKLRGQIHEIQELSTDKNSKQYELMKYLINEVGQIEYIEVTIKYMPSLVNVRDKDDNHLFRNLIARYIDNVIDFNEDNLLYYSNLISFISSHKNFSMTDREKRKCLEDINKCINKLSYVKKAAKKNKGKLLYLEKLLNNIKGLTNNKREIEDIAGKYNIEIYFDDTLEDKVNLIHERKEGIMTDREVIDDYIVTIDKPSTVELDDSLSCRKLDNGNYLLGVHIASVLGYFSYDSNIVKEALDRDRTIYLGRNYQNKDNVYTKIIPIFPYSFSTDIASLITGKPKLARTFYFEIDKNGDVVNERFIKSIIKSDKRMSFKEVNDILENGTDDVNLNITINNLEEVTKLLDKKFHPSELYGNIKENTFDPSDLRVKRVGAENIVYQSAFLTGKMVAEYFYENDYPCLYRVHETNEENEKKLMSLVDDLTANYGRKIYKDLYQLVQGVYPKGWYATEGHHDGLGVDHYCHCTSPIRRSADIVVEHALEVCCDKEPTKSELEDLKNEVEFRATTINAKDEKIDWFIRDYQNQKVYRKK